MRPLCQEIAGKKNSVVVPGYFFNDQPLGNLTNRHNGTDKEKGREGRGEGSEEETEKKS